MLFVIYRGVVAMTKARLILGYLYTMRQILFKSAICCFAAIGVAASAFAQKNRIISSGFAIGQTEGTTGLAYSHEYSFGSKKRLVGGFGGRFTSYLGKHRYYISAPARITSGSTGPGVIFKENIPANIDTFFVSSAQINAINLMVTVGYNLSGRLMVRFNIDAIGVSFGRRSEGQYINGRSGSLEKATPTLFNALLISDNDRGSLNSEFYARYIIKEKWSIRTGLQFHFTEYTTSVEVQQFPEPNDRFRHKSLMFLVGVEYFL